MIEVLAGAASEPAAAKDLEPRLQMLKQLPEDCYKKLSEVDQKLQDSLDSTCELYAACMGPEATRQEEIRLNAITTIAQETRFDSEKDSEMIAKTASERFGRQYETASEAFKKASEGFPEESVIYF